jgi:tetratricopeptide (TPR) repeat protein
MPTDNPTDQNQHRPVPHPKRVYAEKQKSSLKDVDSTARMRTLYMLAYSVPGGVAGALGSWFGGFGPLPGFVLGFLIVFLVTKTISEGSGKTAGTIYHPSGRSTPVKHEYSYAESLAVRGRYEEATVAYEAAVSEFPDDPEPYLRIARLYRDKLDSYEQAVFWFKRARKDSGISKGQELLASQEIIEIYRDKLCTPTRAIPELARLLDRFPEDQTADWARRELARLKEQVRVDEEARAGE